MTKTEDQRPKTRHEVAAILLAAGQSRRMGAFKPLLSFGQTTVIRSCINNLRAGGVQEVVVVLGHRAAEVEASLTDLDHLHIALNPDPDSEMSASIACGVERLPPAAGAALIALTDQPAIPAEVIRTLISEWQSGANLVIPQFEGRGGHPALVDLSFRNELLRLDPHRGLRSLFAANEEQVKRVNVNTPYIARDIDTWDDYRALHQDVFGTPPEDMGC
ncbi:MAG: nucleotidyltransferase family protein [Pyrinomonadaceae bacterium]